MFSKSQRFKDLHTKRVTPGPGEYDVKASQQAQLGSFPKGQRFSDSSDTESTGAGGYDPPIFGDQVKNCDFKVPALSTTKQTKKRSWKRVVAVQTDVTGEIVGRDDQLEEAVKAQLEQCTSLQVELDALSLKDETDKECLQSKLTQQQDEYETELCSLKSSLEHESTNATQLKLDLESVKSSLVHSSDQEVVLNNQILTLTQQLDDATRSASDRETELGRITGSLGDAERRVAHLEVELCELRLTYEQLSKQLEVQQAAKDELEKRIEALTQTTQLQDDSIDSMTTSLARETQLRASTEEALQNKTETIACLKTTVLQLQDHISEWEGLQTDSSERQRQLEQQVSSTTASLHALTEQLDLLKVANEQSRSDSSQLQSTNQSLTLQISSLESSVQGNEVEIETLCAKLEQSKKQGVTIKEKEGKIEELLDLNTLLSAKLDDHKALRDNIDSLEGLADSVQSAHREEINSYEARLVEARSERELVDQQVQQLEGEVQRQESSTAEMRQQYSDSIVALQTKLCTGQQEVEMMDAELSRVTTALQEERDDAKAEAGQVQLLYDELQEKIAPFKEQLDSFELEKKALEGQTKNWASEAAKATQEYAKLLGHQNQRQKIRRIDQISDENFSLKQEVMNLRSSEAKLRRQIGLQQDKIRQMEGKKRFEPTKAFQRNQSENEARPPLQAVNPNDPT